MPRRSGPDGLGSAAGGTGVKAVVLLDAVPWPRTIAIARELDVPVRMYVPYGKAYMPYAPSQLRRNPKVVWWYLRDTLAGGRRAA